MRRFRRKSFKQEGETKRMIYISISVFIIAIITFIVTYIVYSNFINNNATKIAEFKTTTIKELEQLEEENSLKEASMSLGKNVNEVENNINEIDQTSTKIAINTSNILKEINDEGEKNIVNDDTKESNSNNVNEVKEEKIPDPTFIKPVEGEIIKGFSNDSLVYSNTLQEWITHPGIDIKAEKTTVVKSAADGMVKSIKNDPRYGITVIVEHVNGFESIYSNLLTAEFVKEGESIKQGQTIGTVGNTATFEIADETHLHFEILKDGEYIDPEQYIK